MPRLSPADVVGGVAALVRAGVIRPLLPRPSLLGVLAELPLTSPNLGTAVAFQASTQPDAVAVVDDAGMLTWAELDRRVTRLANVLLDSADPGGCVAFALANRREVLECYAAGGRSGLAPVPLDTAATAGGVARILHMQRPAVLVVDDAHRALAERACAQVEDPPALLHVGDGGTYEPALAAAPASAPFSRGTAKVVIHTSGTSGAPKGAERTLGLPGIAAALGFARKVPLRRGDRILIAPPMSHAFASGVAAVAVLLGATVVLRAGCDAAGFEQLVRDADVTAAALSPVMLRRILDHPAPPGSSPLRIVVTSGSPLAVALRDEAQRRWGQVVHDLYGSTEAGWVAISTPEDVVRRRGTVGRPGPGVSVEVVGPDGRPLPPGEVGVLRIRAGGEPAGYTGSDAHRGAWDIGDLGYLDADGYLFVTGRKDGVILTGGGEVHPAEVEGHLEAHPLIREAAVVGVEDEGWGQVAWAYVVGDVQPEQVRTWLRERVAGHKVPARVVLVDALPRTATGKLLKRLLLQSEHPSRG